MKGEIMRNRTGLSLGAVLVLVLMASSVTKAGSDPLLRGNRTPAPRPEPGCQVSGQYTGALSGQIQLGDESFQLSPDVVIYEIGNGFLPVGTVVADRYVFLSGTKVGGTNQVSVVVVRPASDSWPDRGNSDAPITVLDNAKPQ